MQEQERLQVAVRVRPLNLVTELGHENIITVENDLITVKSDLSHESKVKYDIVLSNSSQLEVYDRVVAPIVPSFYNGFNCTVFSYG